MNRRPHPIRIDGYARVSRVHLRCNDQAGCALAYVIYSEKAIRQLVATCMKIIHSSTARNLSTWGGIDIQLINRL